MALRATNTFGLRLLQERSWGFLAPLVNNTNLQQVRHRRIKHWNPKWKTLRRLKFMKVELPNFNENPDDLTEDEMRSRLKEKGMLPQRPWLERQFYISSTGGIVEPYVPPEGDGKVSAITAQGAKQKLQFLEKKTKSMMSIRKIRSFDEEFDTPEFCKEAETIYLKMHECLINRDLENIVDYVTEKAYPEVIHNIQNKTIRWKFIKNIELPRVVHARHTEVITKENLFAQLTVRFHSQQILAIYDRFGRLMHGSEIVAKDVLEYVVFEKHLSNEYGVWRVHSKIIPDWLPPKEPSATTFKKYVPVKKLDEPEKAVTATSDVKPAIKDSEQPTTSVST